MQAGRELDATVAEKVLGWTVSTTELNGYGVDDANEYAIGFPPDEEMIQNVTVPYEIPYYSTEITDAWRVVGRMTSGDRSHEFASFLYNDCPVAYDVGATTVIDELMRWLTPERICLAALKAVCVSVEEE
jgi:hypothetical protein